MSEENRNNDPLAHQKEVLKSAIKKIVDATVDIGVELYFNSKDTNTTGEITNDENSKSNRDSSTEKTDSK